MVQTRGREGGGGGGGRDSETREPQTRAVSVNSIADSLSLNFLVYVTDMWSYFSLKTN